MAWADSAMGGSRSTVKMMEIPIFPLRTVLFPGALLPLRLFEQRYLDMAAASLRENTPFGICLIESGEETGAVAKPHAVGTLAEIVQWDMEQLGILQVATRGGQRFRILEQRETANHLLLANVELIPNDGPIPLPAEHRRLLPLLQRIIDELGTERIPEPHDCEDAEWVGFRITEVLPIQNLAKQKLLELEDPLVRIEILENYLDQRKVLG
jgi:uncharacterized protein